MIGQGGPLQNEQPRTAISAIGRSVWCCAVAVAFVLGLASPLRGEPLDLRVRAAWGGGAPRCWRGHFRLQDAAGELLTAGRISEIRPIGLNPDQAGTMSGDGPTLRVAPRLPREYDAVQFRIQAPRDARLRVDLTAQERPGKRAPVAIPLTDLLKAGHSSLLDDHGNQLRVRRAPGDTLRIRFDRSSLVFAGGERFEFSVRPHLLPVEPDSTLTCEVVLREPAGSQRIWEQTRDFRTDSENRAPELGPFSVPLPDRSGAFDLLVTVSRRRLPTPFSPLRAIEQREVQVVVVADRSGGDSPANWHWLDEIRVQSREVAASDRRSRLWSPLSRLPGWWWVPGGAGGEARRPVGNGRARTCLWRGEGFVELEPGGWQAYPLPIQELHRPHRLEIDYAAGQEQVLNVRIIEANAAGKVSPFGPAAGLSVESPRKGQTDQVGQQQLVFWPQTQTAVVLVTNMHPSAPAVFGRIRVAAGPPRLVEEGQTSNDSGRLWGAFLDRPLFTDEFSARNALEPASGRTLTDWRTFYDGADRLADYLHSTGYNAAMVSVLHDGSALYPSRLLESTPRYENGLFFNSGQDPIRKDVLELMFRVFERERLQLIPLLHLSMPLPELEQLLRESPVEEAGDERASEPGTDPTGIELVGPDGRTWRTGAGRERASGPYYNPLDPRVQQAIRRVVVELVDRYRQSPSFGGIAIRLSPDTYALFPDAMWGADRRTVERFDAETGAGVSHGDRDSWQEPLQGAKREAWLAWRAEKLAEFYRQLESDLVDRVPDARLYLAGADMLHSPSLRSELLPRLPNRRDLSQVLLRVGIDPRRYADSDRLVLLRPQRLAPLISLEEQAVNLQLRQSPEMDALFAQSPAGATQFRPLTGSLFYHEPQTLIPASFPELSPFGVENTSNWFLAQTPPAGDRSRRRFTQSLAAMDSQVLFDGGWMLGQPPMEGLSALLATYRQLPAGRFEDLPSEASEDEQSPVVVRRLSTGQRTYLYVVNNSPWSLSVSLDLDDRRPFSLEALGDRVLPEMTQGPDGLNWRLDLEPYDLVAARLSAPGVQIRGWKPLLGRDVLVKLRQDVEDMWRRVSQLRNPQALNVLTNPDFEKALSGDLLPGWEYSTSSGTEVAIDETVAHSGQHSLRLKSSGPVVWVRSNPFPTPLTGRLDLWVWLRIEDPQRQPPLQLAIEGRLNGEAYYRPARLGRGAPGGVSPPPLSDKWEPYMVRIDDLPSQVTDLRVAIDLMGRGEVWVDEVQVFDLWFDANERNELLKLSALANLYLGKGAALDCERITRGYWGQFLERHVPLHDPPLAQQTLSEDEPPGLDQEPGTSTGWLQRLLPSPPRLPRLRR